MNGKKKEKTSNRGDNPSPLTKMILCARAAGRCQFEGCNKKLFIDGVTLKKVNNSNIAHIVASAPDGPRGNNESYELSDKIENLMLMCQEHHKLIDDNPEVYTISVLKDMKAKQEQKIEYLLDSVNYPKSEIIIFESRIKNEVDAKVNYKQAVEAIRSEGNNPASSYGVHIVIDCHLYYRSVNYWKDVEKELVDKVNYQVESLYRYSHDLQLAIFPIAPTQLIIKLGNLLGDKRKIDIYQKTRCPDTWQWQSKDLTNTFNVEKISLNQGHIAALVMSLTAEIDISRIREVINASVIYVVKAKRIGVDCIQSLQDLNVFWQKYQDVCDQIKNNDGYSEISLFPAIPVSAAFEIGRRYMTKTFPKIHIYDEYDGFFETITIGGDNFE